MDYSTYFWQGNKIKLRLFWALTISLALLGLTWASLTLASSPTAVDHTLPPTPDPAQERLWAQAGLNDAWYLRHGYTDIPPPSAPSPFWPQATPPAPHLAPASTLTEGLTVSPTRVSFQVYGDQLRVLTATVEVDHSDPNTTWRAGLAPGGGLSLTLIPTNGLSGQAFSLTLDSRLYPPLGSSALYTHTGSISVTAWLSDNQIDSQTVSVSLSVDPHHPRLWLSTDHLEVGPVRPGVYTRTLAVDNRGGYSLTWHTQAISLGLMPHVTPAQGVQRGTITVTVDARGYPTTTAVYTGLVRVEAAPGTGVIYPVLDAPQEVLVRLLIVDRFVSRLPIVMKEVAPAPSATPTPPPTVTPTPTASASATPSPTPVPPAEEVRAIWITRYDWTSLYASEGPEDIDEIVANVDGAGFNTLFFQVRVKGDAYYTPGLEPWTDRLNDAGQLGQDPGWNPLAYLIQQAHARGLEVHAYVNVYPAWLGETAPPDDTTPEPVYWTWSHAYGWDDWRHWHRTNGPMLLNASYLWASPGVNGVRDHVVAVVSDIVARYPVDGVHLDRVRYANSPYSYDPISNAASGYSQPSPERAQWQRERVTDLVRQTQAAIQAIRPGTRLSAAVWFCYYEDGCGYDLSSGYADYYQDSLGWLAEGIVDGIAPMLYEWAGFDDLATWQAVMHQFQNANAGRDVYPGIGADFDNFGQIADRIQAARQAGTAGHAIFSYGMIDARGYWDDLANGPYADPP